MCLSLATDVEDGWFPLGTLGHRAIKTRAALLLALPQWHRRTPLLPLLFASDPQSHLAVQCSALRS